MFEEVKQIALEAGRIAADEMGSLVLKDINSKAHLDLVTYVDRSVEQFISERISNFYPDDGIFGEEGSSQPSSTGRTWVVDPIDGTFNFVRKSRDWSISIGLLENDRTVFGVIYAPMKNELYVGGKGLRSTLNGQFLPTYRGFDRSTGCVGVGFHPQVSEEERFRVLSYLWSTCGVSVRHCGAATTSLTDVAQGFTDGYVGVGESAWDVAAAMAILEQVGVKSNLRWKGLELGSKLNVAVGSEEVLDMLKPISDGWE